MDDLTVVIPARYDSTRLPGKVLRELAGQPVIHHVIARGVEAGAARLIVATDSPRVAEACAGRAEVIMTAAEHSSGTERLAEVARQLALPAEAVVVNLQGDEPLMPPALLRATAMDLIEHPSAAMATVAVPLRREELDNPNAVKVVTDASGYALYFSRAPIPWPRGEAPKLPCWRRHLGVYAYRVGFLAGYSALEPAPMERLEQLEQLRALWHGHAIHVLDEQEHPPAGIDTEADLERMRRYF